mmetsp:Transcript_10418/g.20979  ORF Transcript_10418/g.20979 Transcript_10418/m.20979 type:complete len:312 (+) Transcript_10418:85-1020(+)
MVDAMVPPAGSCAFRGATSNSFLISCPGPLLRTCRNAKRDLSPIPPHCRRNSINTCHRKTTTRPLTLQNLGLLAHENDDDTSSDNDVATIADQVRSSRHFRHVGILVGSTVLLSAASLGVAVDMIDPTFVLAPIIVALLYFVFNTLSYNEPSDPLPEHYFEVKESTIPSAGLGLFASAEIPCGTYLFDYEGDILSEELYFVRYPDGEGRYVAVIDEKVPLPLPGKWAKWTEPKYIDGVDPATSNLARYMNSKSKSGTRCDDGADDGPNVIWRKQRYDDQSGSMHFYTSCDVEAGDELCFDYGDNYWDAVVQ